MYDTEVLKRFLKKQVLVVVSYGNNLEKSRVYNGTVLYVTDSHILILDKYGKEVLIGIQEIRRLEISEEEHE